MDNPQGIDARELVRLLRALTDTKATSVEKGHALYRRLAELSDEIAQHLAAEAEATNGKLRAELEELTVAGRKAKDDFNAAHRRVSSARGAYNTHLDKLSMSRLALATAQQKAPGPDDWPTKAEIDAHKLRLYEAELENKRAEQRAQELDQAWAAADLAAEEARARLSALRQRRDQIRVALGLIPKDERGPYGMQGKVPQTPFLH